MPGKFEVYQDKAGKHRFRLKAAYGEVVAVGEAYESQSGAHAGTTGRRRRHHRGRRHLTKLSLTP
jgi:uncharacterized protein YegP (UPF0339 family)